MTSMQILKKYRMDLQASRQWNTELTSQLKAYGFAQSPHDHCLFILSTSTFFLALLVYLGDTILTGNSNSEISKVKHFLGCKFTIKDMDYAKYFLGLEFARSQEGLHVNQ